MARTKTKSETLLTDYKRKRDFTRTKEPDDQASFPTSGHRFVVQKHAARRLHYDFRLELDGVLKSWAVTRGPSLDPAEKRLAVRTEDHPLAYAEFEGIIPQGEYGGGTVMLWDEGEWEPLHDPHDGLKEGMLHFLLHGKRMTGGWALIRMRPRPGEKRESWLLVKERDEEADDRDRLLEKNEKSVRTGRKMEQIAKDKDSVHSSNRTPKSDAKPKPAPKKTKKAGTLPSPPAFQLATLVSGAPDGDDWLHEVKFDGYRCAVAIGGGEVRCYTRKGLDWTDKFREVAEAAQKIDAGSALIDGEVVAYAKGRSDFGTLQAALKTGADLSYFAFDLLELNGKDLKSLPLIERKAKLQKLLAGLPKNSPIQYSDHVEGSGREVLKRICGHGLEGIISKRADAHYTGRRTGSWLKIKCTRRQEFVIIGWTPSDTNSRPFASLLLGYYSGNKLVYSGRVGTGFDADTLDDLAKRFAALSQKSSPAGGVPADARRYARWVEPKLVAEIAFTEFTEDGVLRHPSFQGLREDKEPANVVRETERSPAEAVQTGTSRDKVAGVRLSHPDKVVFAKQGITKSDLANYYEAIAERMLPYISGRPLSLVRCPQGSGGKCFFQKHDQGGFPDAMKTVAIAESSGEKASYFYIDTLAGLVGGVQVGVLEFHIWGCRRDRIEQPDRLVFDLDPDEALGFADVSRAAMDVRDRLDGLGLKSWAMVTGGKGIHVVIPLARRNGWDDVKIFARGFARQLSEEEPERFLAKASKASRKGRIFVDWLRNDRGSTAICPYSTRAREGAPVAMPVSWDEFASLKSANGFTIANAPQRVREIGDPWANMTAQSLSKKLLAGFG